MYLSDTDQLTQLVSRVMRIESVTLGDRGPGKQNYLVDYQGQFYNEDTAQAYDKLADSLRRLEITPLFRLVDGRQHIILMPGISNPSPSNPKINLILFILTALSVLFAGVLYAYEGPASNDVNVLMPGLVAALGGGAAFAASLLAILLAHEFGHYLVARYHKTAATLPYFIPFPLSYFGTMGAVIVQKESHKNKRVLLDIGLAGPLAGLVVAVPVLLLGLSLSEVSPIATSFSPDQGISLEGNSLLYLLAKFAVFRQWLPEPATYGGLSPLTYWVMYFFTGHPTPYGGMDVMLHPVAWAGWAGLLVTALNLIPAGQLDGGHIVHGLLGRRAAALLPVIFIGLVLLGIVWNGWWLWAALIFFMGRTFAEPLDQITPLDRRRKILAVVALIIFFLVFTPVPIRLISG